MKHLCPGHHRPKGQANLSRHTIIGIVTANPVESMFANSSEVYKRIYLGDVLPPVAARVSNSPCLPRTRHKRQAGKRFPTKRFAEKWKSGVFNPAKRNAARSASDALFLSQ
jgi:hypothetical protein